MRKGLLVVLALAALSCGGGDDEAATTTTASTSPPTTLISFTDWRTSTDVVCAIHIPSIAQMGADPGATFEGVVAANGAFIDALVATPVPDDRGVEVRNVYQQFRATDAILDEVAVLRSQGNLAAVDLKLAEYRERFADAEELLSGFDLPSCNGPS